MTTAQPVIVWTGELLDAARAVSDDPGQLADARARANEFAERQAGGRPMHPSHVSYFQCLRQRLVEGLASSAALEAAWGAAYELASRKAPCRYTRDHAYLVMREKLSRNGGKIIIANRGDDAFQPFVVWHEYEDGTCEGGGYYAAFASAALDFANRV